MFIFPLCSYCEALPIRDLFFNNKHMMQPFLLHPLDYGHGWRREKYLLNKGSYLHKDIDNPKIIKNDTVNKFGGYK